MSKDLTEVIDDARSWLAYPGAPAIEPGEETATRFARALVQLADACADACVVGATCDRHGGAVHGYEAEELRKGIDYILEEHGPTPKDVLYPHDDYEELRRALIQLLDRVDARDSLAFLEATTCDIAGCLHHAHPDCPCGHPPGTVGVCGGCNCCDERSE
jgi:hypothetical protein